MSTERQKLYLYVDESGQESQGEFFTVAVAMVNAKVKAEIEMALIQAERVAGKGLEKWVSISPVRRARYLESILPVLGSIAPIYYRKHGSGTAYLQWTTATVVAAIQHAQPEAFSHITVVIDGLNVKERQQVSRLLRQHTLPYRRDVRGGRDESSPFIRLADALAGFIRHVHRENSYATQLWKSYAQYFHQV